MQKIIGQFLSLAFALLLPGLAWAGPVHQIVSSFELNPQSPSYGALVLGPDGNYWGTTIAGGTYGGATGNGTIYKVNAAGTDWQTVVSFSNLTGPNKGKQPFGGLTNDGAGNLWGTTNLGGSSDKGTVFKYNVSSGVLTTVAEFNGNGTTKGAGPWSTLVSDGAGFLWGTTQTGGASGLGTVFKVQISSGTLTTVGEFAYNASTNPSGGSNPKAGLFSDGTFMWGTTYAGGASDLGTVFKVNIATGGISTGLVTVAEFTYNASTNTHAGSRPQAALVSDGAGYLWGSTSAGGTPAVGTANSGTIFKIDQTSGALTTVVELSNNGTGTPANKGMAPLAPLIYDGAGSFWGTTSAGSGTGSGTIFKIDRATGALSTPFTFTYSSTGSSPAAGLVNVGGGIFWGTTQSGGPLGVGTVFKWNTNTSTQTNLVTFNSNATTNRGSIPYSSLMPDASGLLWGTTSSGGAYPFGTVFKVNPASGTLSTVVDLTGSLTGTSKNGSYPSAGLTSDSGGTFYWGVTIGGGTGVSGTVFKISPGGTLTTQVNFASPATNRGSSPQGRLVYDGAGYFWGTCKTGATSNNGTVYKVSTAGVFTNVAEFTGTAGVNKGTAPAGALVSDGSGFLWGTTSLGGTNNAGTVFKVPVSAGAYVAGTAVVTTVVEFGGGGGNRGANPYAGLVNDGAGFMWGTTSAGGNGLVGTIFKVEISTGTVTTVVDLSGTTGANKGSAPWAPLVSDGAGNLWGTTNQGGAADLGTVFNVNIGSGTQTTIMEFTGIGTQSGAGANPGYGALIKHSDGNFYGTTANGGPSGGGTVYRLRYGPSPSTQAATSVAFTTATINGTVNPNGIVSACSFEYGTSATLAGATTVGAGSTTAGSAPEAVAASLTGLTGATTYYYRVAAANGDNPNVQKGGILSFTTGSNIAPTVTLAGTNPLTLEAAAASYTDAGATASDPEDGVLTPVIITNTVNRSVPGSYAVTWRATDSGGSTGSATRTVNVVDTTAPVVTPPANVVAEASSGSGATVSYAAATASDFVGVTSISYSQNTGTVFPLGVTTVTVTARDAANNAGTGTFTVTVRDTTAPVVTPPANVVVEATSASGAVATYAAATATDAVGVSSISYSQASGTVFPLGVTTVTVTARDAANNAGTGTFTVTVRDTTAPVVTPPANVVVEATSASGAVATYAAATATDAVGVSSISYSQASGTVFPLGVTTVTVTARDAANNAGTATFTVTVRDTTAPVVTPPANVVVEATSASGAVATYAAATATDAVGVSSISYSQASGTVFPLGVTTLIVTARDAANNAGTATFTVTVRDTTAPVVTPPANVVVEATSASGAVATYAAATATDAVGVSSISYSQNTGTTFPRGVTTVTVTARDAANNAGTGTFTVTVRDTTAPVVTPPANVTVSATSPAGAFATYAVATATDAVGVTSLTYSQASGTTFPIGTTTVTATARDAANNAGTATFTVTVSPLSPVETWRYQYFGSIANSGNAADNADPDGDGLKNLLEFGNHTNPTVPNGSDTQVARTSTSVELTYTRAKAAVNAGVAFDVEWNENLATPTWSSVGVAELVLSEDATVQHVKATVPLGTAGLRFVRLRVHKP